MFMWRHMTYYYMTYGLEFELKLKMALQEGQHQSPIELITQNFKSILRGVLNKLECQNGDNNIDFARYRVEWLCSVLLRLGGNLEESLLPHLQEAQQMLAILDNDQYFSCGRYPPPVVETGIRGRPKFYIPKEQLEYFIEYGFKATDIAKMLYVSEKTVYRRLEEHGMSMRTTYSQIAESELDVLIRSISHVFPNSGYKTMRGHLLSRGLKVQESRVREAMRRTDPEGTVVRALQLRVTHRRVYSVKQPLSLWHMDGNHKLIRYM